MVFYACLSLPKASLGNEGPTGHGVAPEVDGAAADNHLACSNNG